MEACHEGLQAVEISLAKLPEHFNSFKARNKEQRREQSERTKLIKAIQSTMPGLSPVAIECQSRVTELNASSERWLPDGINGNWP